MCACSYQERLCWAKWRQKPRYVLNAALVKKLLYFEMLLLKDIVNCDVLEEI
jgi:hypothetical protein